MKKVFDYIKKHPVFLIIVVLVLIPVIIYFLSVIPLLPSGGNDWSGFWGGYIGAIIGGICTVIGVHWTIEYSQENYQEDVRNRTLPYISLSALQQDILMDLLHFSSEQLNGGNATEQINESSTYREYRLNKVFIIIEKDKINYKKDLTDRQEELVKCGGLEEEHRDGITCLVDRKIISAPIELENVGNGVALQFRVGLNKIDDKDPKFILPLDLKIGEKMCLHIFSEYSNDIIGDYLLEVYYKDILNNSYCQKFKFKIEKDGSQNRAFSSLELCSKQERE